MRIFAGFERGTASTSEFVANVARLLDEARAEEVLGVDRARRGEDVGGSAVRGSGSASWFEPANWKRAAGETRGKTLVSDAAA